jgi:putative serine protease PepD
LIKSGKATYPVIGISIDMKYAGDGALISKNEKAILPGGPAAKAGLKAGDVITKFDGRPVHSAEELIVAIRAKSVGEKVEISYTRNGSTITATVTLTAGK